MCNNTYPASSHPAPEAKLVFGQIVKIPYRSGIVARGGKMSDLLQSRFAVKKPGWLDDFKAFIMRGNVVDLAVGVVIGVAFTGIVNSLVKDIITPLIGLITGGVDFSNHFVTLKG